MGRARVFGASTPAWLASYDPATSSWRTSQLSLLGGLAEFSATWPRSGMTRSGTAFRLQPLVPLTDATGSGLWPTPNAADGLGGRISSDETILRGTRPSGAKVQVTLREAIRRRELIPTPTHGDSKSAANLTAGRNDPNSQHHSGTTLTDYVRLWPTPTHRLGTQRGAQAKRYHDPRRSNDLDDAVAARGTPGQLNPTWVEWLMGFPLEWTALPPSETPSSRKSRNGSAGASSTGNETP
jgi:hypothetical protein